MSKTPNWWVAATKSIIGDSSLPDAMVLAFAEVGWRTMRQIAHTGPIDHEGRLGYFLETPIDWKCTKCRCPGGCRCCDADFCGCTMEYSE